MLVAVAAALFAASVTVFGAGNGSADGGDPIVDSKRLLADPVSPNGSRIVASRVDGRKDIGSRLRRCGDHPRPSSLDSSSRSGRTFEDTICCRRSGRSGTASSRHRERPGRRWSRW